MLSEVFKNKYSSKQDGSWIALCDWAMEVTQHHCCRSPLVNTERQAMWTRGLRTLDPLSWWEDCQCHCRRASGMGDIAPAIFGKRSRPRYFTCSWLRPHGITWRAVSLSLYSDSHHHGSVMFQFYHVSESPAVLLQTHFSGSHPRVSDSLGLGR